ncbi:bacillithiol biosynthesis deacetylase BshB1 [Fulvitalea axinellae]|uniref:Bacillithiol biosynthesis deacetylase BshB1 n=1 Tax=Fulvitalea axinellae TaxID=1182444 RepID=A0AAU9CDE8_9BACT|nr:bacillithiol biosynthesis deacetylase BshB1 [Fulvitalea axinellae]
MAHEIDRALFILSKRLMYKTDILVLVAHPDDAELSCGGTIAAHVAKGHRVGIVDLTRGELGTRGTAESRAKEAADAAKILGVAFRENLGLPDGFFENTKEYQLEVVKAIRKHCPKLVIANAVADRHPDHSRAAELVKTACFLAGLPKVETELDGEKQEAFRPENLYHILQTDYIKPDFVFDITEYMDVKLEAVRAFKTQFHIPDYDSEEPQTLISSPEFMEFLKARAKEMGHSIRTGFGEGFTKSREIGVNDLFSLL